MDEMIIDIDTDTPSVKLNGEDITNFINGISFIQAGRDQAVVGLELVRAKVRANGSVVLQNLMGTTDATAAAQVKALDWSKLKEQAMENLDFEDDPMQSLLNAVVEALNSGTQS